MPYARPPLSEEFLGGEESHVDLHPAKWFDDNAIAVLRTVAVDGIDTADHVVLAGRRRHPYRWLVLACGSRPAPLPVPATAARSASGPSMGDRCASTAG
jgi:3-phenylpropionate/trans-cinnamate dioxygenase ferredoxin reductase subunit